MGIDNCPADRICSRTQHRYRNGLVRHRWIRRQSSTTSVSDCIARVRQTKLKSISHIPNQFRVWLSSCNSGPLEYTKHCVHLLPPQLHSPHRTHPPPCSNHAICEIFQNLWRIGHPKPTPISERTLNVSLDPFSHGGALNKPCLR